MVAFSTRVLGLTFEELLNLSRSSDFGFTKKTLVRSGISQNCYN